MINKKYLSIALLAVILFAIITWRYFDTNSVPGTISGPESPVSFPVPGSDTSEKIVHEYQPTSTTGTSEQDGKPPKELPKTASPRQNKTGQIIGAIRWDAWHDGQVGQEVEKVLGPKKWRYRMPFFGQELSDTTVLLRADTQAVMDREIGYANAAGLDYWAFLSYEPLTTSEMSKSFRLYLSSSKKQDINFAFILHSNGLPEKTQWPTLIQRYVGYFKDPAYQKVAGGRPLFYIFPVDGLVSWTGSELEARNALAELRDATVAAGLPPPYFVAMVWDAAEGAYYIDKLGLQAISAYANGAGYTYEERPYSALAHSNQNFWEASKNTGKNVIPIVSAGWDPRPRLEIPVFWGDPNPVPGTYYMDAAPTELANNLKAAMDWNAVNPTAAEAKAVIIYAWNEIDEGGWLLPANTAFNPVGTGRLDAIGTMIRNWKPPL